MVTDPMKGCEVSPRWAGARAALVAALGAACVLAGCGVEGAAGEAPPAAASAANAAPVRWSSADAIKAQCIVQSQQSVKLKAEIGGRIDAVSVALGQAVEKGQPLARIDTLAQVLELERLRLAEQNSRVRIELLTVQVRQSEAQWQALQPLYAERLEGTLPREALALREKQAELQLAKLALSDAQLQVRNLERVLRQAEIRSPMRGVVLARNAEVGMIVSPGVSGLNGSDVLFDIGDPDRLRAQCAAREGDASRLQSGQRLSLVLDGLRDREIELRVTRVAPAIVNESGSSTLPFWVDFDRPTDLPVLAGMHGNATVHLGVAGASPSSWSPRASAPSR